MKATRRWLGDLARLAGASTTGEALTRLANAAGFVGSDSPPMAIPTVTARASGPPVAVPAAQPADPLAPVRFFRAESAWFAGPLQLDGTETPVVPPPTPFEEPDGGSLLDVPPTQEAVRWSTLWPRLRSLLRVKARGRAPDVAKLVRLIAKGRVLTDVPRVQRYRWPERIELWLDRSWRNLPLFPDQARVVERLCRVVGHQRVSAVVLSEEDQPEQRDAPDGFATGRLDRAPPCVLVLGDLGHWGPPATQRGWHRAAVALRRRGLEPLAVVPPGATSKSWWREVSWERPSRGSPHRVEGLLLRIAAAGLVEPGLVREIRLAWREELGDLAVEFDLLRHRDVEAFDPTAVVLTPEARAKWRERLRAFPFEDKQRLATIVARWHEKLPGELGHAETIAQLGLGWRPATHEASVRIGKAHRWLRQLSEHLDPRLVRSRQVEAWRDYAQRLTQGLPDVVFGHAVVGDVLTSLRERARQDVAPPAELDAPRPWSIEHVGPSDESGELPFAILGDGAAPKGSFLGTVMAGDQVAIARSGRALGDAGPVLEARATRSLGPAEGWVLRTPYQRLTLSPWRRADWAVEAGRDRAGLWATLGVEGIPHRLRWIPPGRYLRGSPPTEAGRYGNEGPQHSVVISRGFWLGQTPVTQALWTAVMGENPSRFEGPERPVENVSWEDARRFCQALGARCPGLTLRLPTEAEWEYACRAGTRTATWVGDLDLSADGEAPQLAAVAWYQANSGGETKPVAGREPNPWGLHDMLGNVWEWCEDAFDSYSESALVDPVTTAGDRRVLRGGSWNDGARCLRAAFRYAFHPGYRDALLGFRLAGGPAPSGGAENGAGDRPREVARDAPEGDPSGSTSS